MWFCIIVASVFIYPFPAIAEYIKWYMGGSTGARYATHTERMLPTFEGSASCLISTYWELRALSRTEDGLNSLRTDLFLSSLSEREYSGDFLQYFSTSKSHVRVTSEHVLNFPLNQIQDRREKHILTSFPLILLQPFCFHSPILGLLPYHIWSRDLVILHNKCNPQNISSFF